jgi:hypothetical protein
MGTKTFNSYEDLLTFTRASGGHALRPVSYGTELVTNGTFDTDVSGWSDDSSAGGSIAWNSSGYLNLAATTGTSRASQSIDTTAGNIYFISLEVIALNGSTGPLLYFDGVQQGSALTVGTTTFVYVATGSSVAVSIRNFTTGTTVYIDNVSVKEVLFDQPDGTLTLFEHPDNIPRVEWDSAGNRLGLLVEEARTNLDTQSTYFAGAASVTATKNYTAPDGSQDASTLDYTAVSTPYLNTTNISFSSGTTYSFSFYFKRGTGTQAVQTLLYGSTFNSGGANCVVVFDLDNETTSVASGTFVSHSITNVGGGWYRCMCSATATATASQNQQILRLGAADAGNYDYIFGKQVEAGSFPTSYIKTTGATATRSADVASVPVADFGYNTAVGSIVAEVGAHNTDSNAAAHYTLSKTTLGSEWVSTYSSSTNVAFRVREGGSDQGVITISDDIRASGAKTGFAFKEDDFAAVVNGGTLGSMASGIEELKIAGFGSNPRQLCGHIKSIKYYPRRLTNAQLQEITS